MSTPHEPSENDKLADELAALRRKQRILEWEITETGYYHYQNHRTRLSSFCCLLYVWFGLFVFVACAVSTWISMLFYEEATCCKTTPYEPTPLEEWVAIYVVAAILILPLMTVYLLRSQILNSRIVRFLNVNPYWRSVQTAAPLLSELAELQRQEQELSAQIDTRESPVT